jgi:hypothetical protein
VLDVSRLPTFACLTCGAVVAVLIDRVTTVDTAQIISTLISLAAFGVAAYGITERRLGARRSERVRLTTIVENLTKVRLELLDLVAKGQTIGDVVEAVNARVEVLSQQALSLIQQHSLTVTSTECREVGYALQLAGYREDAEFMWDLACERAQKEGDTQVLYASRGYAYFLFYTQRESKAREILQETLSNHETDNESASLAHVLTLKQWVEYEVQAQGPEAELVLELTKQIVDLESHFSSAAGKAKFKEVIENGNIVIRIERAELNSGHPQQQ